jgi:hypothetical protein
VPRQLDTVHLISGDTVEVDIPPHQELLLPIQVHARGLWVLVEKWPYEEGERAKRQLAWMQGRWMWRLALWLVRRGL